MNLPASLFILACMKSLQIQMSVPAFKIYLYHFVGTKLFQDKCNFVTSLF
uniref:Alternative protein SPTLC2 n=1 Tax=Homo sapiens TaxID=9606 RepID=L8E997_HUMAN|nr:alternative protein SPTLC2 [Homo sapiens]